MTSETPVSTAVCRTFRQPSVATDATGQASTTLTLGTAAGASTVTATYGVSKVTFTETATAPVIAVPRGAPVEFGAAVTA